MFNKNSLYALNKKDPDAIVYPTADGKTVRITREDFPSEEEFLAFKAWSDEDYKEKLRAETEDKRHTVSIHELEETKTVCIPSAEEIYVEITSKTEIRTYSKKDVKRFLSTLTKTQRKAQL